MATANNVLRVSELDYASIRENLKTYLRSQSEFNDFDFEGSGMSVLLDLLAYNTHYMGYYLNMVANEAFLDTAQLRPSILSQAKLLNYVPRSKTGPEAIINITVTPSNVEDQTASIVTLDRYSRFLGEDIDGVNYPFVAVNSNSATKIGGSFSFSNVHIKQGEVITRQFLMDSLNTKRRFEIASANVDTSTLIVTVQQSSTNTDTIVYNRADDITEVRGNSAVYFIEENSNQNYTIYFGDNIIGKTPDIGSIVICTYLDTVGSPANNISRFTYVDTAGIGGKYSDNVVVSLVSTSRGGTEKESIEEVRFRAPYFYTTQNRAITTQDYSTLILKDFPNVDSVSVWGGEENDPPIYGKVFMSLKTRDNYFLTNLEKENIKNQLIRSRNVLTIIPEIVDPSYTYLLVRGSVYYNSSLTSLASGDIAQLVHTAIDDYRSAELDRFDSTFRKSRLQSYIENSEKSITASDIKIYLQKRITLDTTIVNDYRVQVNTPIKKGDYVNKLTTSPAVNVYDASGVLRQVLFEEVPSAFTGVDSIAIVNPGINFTSTPTVTITGDGTGATAVAKIVSNRLASITVTNKGTNYSRAVVTLSGGGGSEAVAVARLESKFGTLRTYYFKTNGEKVIVNDNAGTINYETGEVVITALRTTGTAPNDFYDTNELVINMPIDNEVITRLRNRIITIDQNDPLSIQFEVVAEK